MSTISFEATPYNIASWTVLVLPKAESAKLSSRGMNMTRGTIEGQSFEAPLEPDGRGSHWFRVDDALKQKANIEAGDTVTVELEPLASWSRPEVPADLAKALAKAPEAQELWEKITPKAQWEWVRWIRATKNPQTRQRRIEVACSKLTRGDRRPCCFNSGACTEPYVSHNWMLLEPAKVA